jgi:hypothetical protein
LGQATKHYEERSSEEISEDYSCVLSEIEEAQFVRKIRGPGKYKGRPPIICSNCGRIGHFSTKYPYAEREYNNAREECLSITMETKHVDQKENPD